MNKMISVWWIFLAKSMRDILRSLPYKIHIFLPIPCLAAKELRKSKKIGFTLAPKIVWFYHRHYTIYTTKFTIQKLLFQVEKRWTTNPSGRNVSFPRWKTHHIFYPWQTSTLIIFIYYPNVSFWSKLSRFKNVAI